MFVHRKKWCISWRGRAVLLLLLGSIAFFLFASIYPFLALNRPIKTDTLVLESWLDGDSMERFVNMANADEIKHVYVVGTDFWDPAGLMPFPSSAESGYHQLVASGVSTQKLSWVSAGLIYKDRTYQSALALRNFVKPPLHRFILVSGGPHTRRSCLLYQRAFGDSVDIGCVALAPSEYDPDKWWESSAGVRSVISETIAWFYAQFFFRAQ